MKPRSTIITFEPFHTDVMVVRGGTLLCAAQKYYKKLKLPLPDEAALHSPAVRGRASYHAPSGTSLIWLHKDAYLGTVSHEAFHILYAILSHRDTPLTDATEEVYAYGLQFLVNEIMSKCFGWKVQHATP